MWVCGKKAAVYKPGICPHLDLGLPSLLTVRNKYLFFNPVQAMVFCYSSQSWLRHSWINLLEIHHEHYPIKGFEMFCSKNKKFKKEIKLFKTHLPNVLKHGTLLSSKIERYYIGKKSTLNYRGNYYKTYSNIDFY